MQPHIDARVRTPEAQHAVVTSSEELSLLRSSDDAVQVVVARGSCLERIHALAGGEVPCTCHSIATSAHEMSALHTQERSIRNEISMPYNQCSNTNELHQVVREGPTMTIVEIQSKRPRRHRSIDRFNRNHQETQAQYVPTHRSRANSFRAAWQHFHGDHDVDRLEVDEHTWLVSR